jgi:hypothetical protein
MFTSIIFAAAISSSSSNTWTNTNTALEVVYLVGKAMDVGTTMYALNHGATETNPILGKHPSRLEDYSFSAAVFLLHLGVSYLLPCNYREIWQVVSIAYDPADAITNNWRAMGTIRMSF